MNQKGITSLPILIAIIGVVAFLAVANSAPVKNTLLSSIFPKDSSQAASSFFENFDIPTSSPQVFDPANWDVNVAVENGGDGAEGWKAMESMQAMHGPDCSPPTATHPINNQFDAVFMCKNHMMTSINAGYGIAYLTPNHMADFSNGESVISWDVSTFQSSGRDWWDVWVQPYNDNFATPLEDWLPAFSGEPKRAMSIKMEGGTFSGAVVRDFNSEGLNKTTVGWKKVEDVLADYGFSKDPARRDTFELRISRNHIKFCMTKIGNSTTTPTPVNHCWIDTNISDLGWDKGLVTIGHHSYNPSKDCTPNPPLDCYPNTWHWDNVSINPSTPFTMIKGDVKAVKSGTTDTINFPSPAPANANLRFIAQGIIQVSFNNGQTWQPAHTTQTIG
jgi:hypothetical protein